MRLIQRHVWIVEMLCSRGWTTTVGAALTRDDARDVIYDWRIRNPDNKFRLAVYRKPKERSK